MVTFRRAVTALVALSFALAACKGSTSDVKSEKSMEVMGTWATFFNETIAGVPDLLDDHFEKMPHGQELTVEHLTKNAKFGCTGIGWMDMKKKEAENALGAAKKASTNKFSHLPGLGDAMWAAATKVDTTRVEFCKHLKAEDFKDDKGAEANELHKTMMEAAKEWQASSNAMADALDAIENEQVLAQIAKHEKDKDYSYWFRYFNFKAKQTLSAVQRDHLKASASIDALEADHKALTEFTKGKDKLNDVFKTYVDMTDNLMASAKKLRRAQNDAKDDEGKKVAVQKQMSSMISGYNSLVQMHNTLSEMEANKLLK